MIVDIEYLRSNKVLISWAIDRMPLVNSDNKNVTAMHARNKDMAKRVLYGDTYASVARDNCLTNGRVKEVAFREVAIALSLEARYNRRAAWIAHNSGIGPLMSPPRRLG